MELAPQRFFKESSVPGEALNFLTFQNIQSRMVCNRSKYIASELLLKGKCKDLKLYVLPYVPVILKLPMQM